MSHSINITRSHVLGLYRSILREGRRLPIYSRRRYVEVKVKTDFLAFRAVTDSEIILRQVQLAEDMLESLTVMGESQRSFFEWEESPIPTTTVNGKPQRRQTPPRIPINTPKEPETRHSSHHTEDF